MWAVGTPRDFPSQIQALFDRTAYIVLLVYALLCLGSETR